MPCVVVTDGCGNTHGIALPSSTHKLRFTWRVQLAMKAMCPPEALGGGPVGSCPTASGDSGSAVAKMETIRTSGYLQVAKNNLEYASVLDKIKVRTPPL